MKNRPLCSICLILSVFIIISVCWGGEFFLKEFKTSPAETHFQAKENVCLSGRVYQKKEKDKYQILYLKNNSITYHQQSLKESQMIVYDENKLKVNIGDVLRVQGEINFFDNARNPGNFDQKRYYQRQNIHVSVWAQSVCREKENSRTWYECVKERLYEFRKGWTEKLYMFLEEKDAGTVSAILLGEKAGMDEELKELYQVNGIGHILAISGLHLSFVGLGIYQIFRRISGSYNVGSFFGIIFLSLYVLMVGVTVSVLRAFLTFLFRVGADVTGRNYDGVTALSFSALSVLLWRPLSIYDAGFWLSFGAVAALYFVYPIFRDFPIQSLWASVSIQLVTLPVILVSFYELPTFSIFVNIIVIPLMSLILICIMAGSILGVIILPVGIPFFKIAGMLLKLYEQLCNLAMDLPGARIVTGKPQNWEVAVYYICLFLALCLYRWMIKKRKQERIKSRIQKELRNRRCLVSVSVFALGLLLLVFSFGRNGEFAVTMLDVGQGDCIFIKGPRGGNYLIDGGSSDVGHVGKYRIESFLKSQGVKKIDYVFVSHGDEDHMNGIMEMLERKRIGIEIGTIVLPSQNVWDEKLKQLAEKAIEYETKVAVMEQGQAQKEGEMSLTCLMPDNQGKNNSYKENDYEEELSESGNEYSMVLKLSYHSFDMLFTGDIEGEGEEKLINVLEHEEGAVEVLKVAHHGSKNSSSEEFLRLVKPVVTCISAGKKNRYGHPHQETLDRLKEVKSEIYSTQDCGAITITVGKESFSLQTYCN